MLVILYFLVLKTFLGFLLQVGFRVNHTKTDPFKSASHDTAFWFQLISECDSFYIQQHVYEERLVRKDSSLFSQSMISAPCDGSRFHLWLPNTHVSIASQMLGLLLLTEFHPYWIRCMQLRLTICCPCLVDYISYLRHAKFVFAVFSSFSFLPWETSSASLLITFPHHAYVDLLLSSDSFPWVNMASKLSVAFLA